MKPCVRCKQSDTRPGVRFCSACLEQLHEKRTAHIARIAKELEPPPKRGRQPTRALEAADNLAEAVEELPDIVKTIEVKRALARYWKARGV
jgi:hypothetical protein